MLNDPGTQSAISNQQSAISIQHSAISIQHFMDHDRMFSAMTIRWTSDVP
jgi:hypothetical protein